MFVKSIWEKYVTTLKLKSPYDYERYLKIVKRDDIPSFVRKIKGMKFALSKIYKYGLNKSGLLPKGRESLTGNRPSVNEVMERINSYDVISFDIFNTVIIRNVTDYSDIYHLVGVKLGIHGFRSIRMRAEEEARLRYGYKVVNIFEIYSVLDDWHVVERDKGIRAELDVEKAVCEINPYWKEVLFRLFSQKKKIVFISDMYFNEKQIRELFTSLGFETDGIDLFLSCDYRKSKKQGTLFQTVKEECGLSLKYFHIGDDKYNDCRMARKNGFECLYYQDIHSLGRPFRDYSSNIITDSLLNAIVNVELHSGICKMTELEEFGFNYYGRIFVSYCQWINRYVSEKNIDKVLFVSRDCFLLHQLYNEYYRKVDNEYIYTSRSALWEIVAQYDYDLYLEQNFRHVAFRGGKTISEALLEAELSFLEDKIEGFSLSKDAKLDLKNYKEFCRFMYKYYDEVICNFKDSQSAAFLYFKDIINGCSNICIVDVGWFGSSTIALNDFFKKHMDFTGNIYGVHIGLDYGTYNLEACTTGLIKEFVFSASENYDLFVEHDTRLERILDEIIFSSPEPSLLKYQLVDDQYNLMFAEEDKNNSLLVKEVHRGIVQYVHKFQQITNQLELYIEIPPYVSYKPIQHITQNRNYIYQLFGNYKVVRNTGNVNNEAVLITKA